MPGILYLVSTPIGNLEDITLRALRILKEAGVVAAEDPGHSRKLLSHFKIDTPLTTYNQHSSVFHTDALLARLTAGECVALITDAGTPSISDPGEALVEGAIAAGITVVPVPGPSAVIAALSASGLLTPQFVFEGFLPRSGSSRKERLSAIAAETRAVVLYEAGNRTAQTLADLAKAAGGDRRAVVCRELTKAHEEFRRAALSELAEHYKNQPARGEVAIVVSAADPAPPPSAGEAAAMVTARLREALARGMSERDAVRFVTGETNSPRRMVYAVMLELAREDT